MKQVNVFTYSYLLYLCLIVTYGQNQICEQNCSDTLKLVQILFRHGERSPAKLYKNDPNKNFKWPLGFGSLTNRGKIQMYDLGQYLRNYYSKYIPEYYLPSELSVVSSHRSRCIMSAQLVLAGLYPPVGKQIWNPALLWQPIPVYYLPRHLDNVIVMKNSCPVYDKLLNLTMASKINEVRKKYPELIPYLEEHSGTRLDEMIRLESFYNSLYLEETNGLQVPIWSKKYYPEPLRTIATETLAAFTDTPLMQKLKGGVFLKNVTENMKQKMENNTETKVMMFSGHDLTILNVWRTLRQVEPLSPEHAATLVFELHEKNKVFQIKILYKKSTEDNIEEIEIPGCPAPCEFEKFLETFNSSFPSDWVKECNIM